MKYKKNNLNYQVWKKIAGFLGWFFSMLFLFTLLRVSIVYADCTPIGNCSYYTCDTEKSDFGEYCEGQYCCGTEGSCSGGTRWCESTTYNNGGCEGTMYCCTPGDRPPDCGGCFTPDTKVDSPEGEKEIKDLQEGDEVKSLDPETGEETASVVEKIHEVTRSAYYKIKLKNGKELKVTGEHPLYTLKQPEEPLTFWEYLKTQSFTKSLIDSIF